MSSFLWGYATGLSLVVFIGPVLFVLLTTTLDEGRGRGGMTALGIFVSDCLAVAICLKGGTAIAASQGLQRGMGLAGGLLLLVLGVKHLASPPKSLGQRSGRRGTLAGAFARGFLINFVNPFVFMVWMGLISVASLRWGTTLSLYAYLTGCLLGILTLDLGKVFLSTRLLPWLEGNRLKRVFQISGGILIGFSVRLFLYV